MGHRHWLIASLVGWLVLAGAAIAEKKSLNTDELKAEATEIVTGKVKAVYSREVKSTLYGPGTVETHYLVEILVEGVEKGNRLKKGKVVCARCWKLKKHGKEGRRPGPGGHFAIPVEGKQVRAHLAYEADGGYSVLYPNGFAAANRPKK
jgi:hypothetical protein